MYHVLECRTMQMNINGKFLSHTNTHTLHTEYVCLFVCPSSAHFDHISKWPLCILKGFHRKCLLYYSDVLAQNELRCLKRVAKRGRRRLRLCSVTISTFGSTRSFADAKDTFTSVIEFTIL